MFLPDKPGRFVVKAAAAFITAMMIFLSSAKAADDWGGKNYGRNRVGKGGDYRANGGTQLYSSKNPNVRADIFIQEDNKFSGLYDASEPKEEKPETEITGK